MKRDMDLVRSVLMLVSEANGVVDAKTFVDDENDLQKVAYTIEIMDEAGLIDATVVKACGGVYVKASIERLTWSGNDFLASVSNSKVWSNVKAELAKQSIDAPFSVISAMATKLCMTLAGLS